MFGGKGNNNFSFGTNIIQRLNLYMPTIWELIIPTEKPEMQVTPRWYSGLISLNNSEIITLGGINKTLGKISDVTIINITKKAIVKN